jgi:ABC-type nitrate/sulfonate/bicarbonate transport system ATPase subunit
MKAHVGTLEIRNLGKQYTVHGKDMPVLDNISLSIAPGEFVSIVGASGCGKSTLLRLIVGLDSEYQGTLQLDGQRIAGTSRKRGIVFQEHRLFPWLSVEQNIALGLINVELDAHTKRDRIHEHLELVGLNGFEKAYPYQLSGGMAQRVAIARALVGRPDILLLDEPFGALDALTRSYLQEELQRTWSEEGITMILVTHDVEEAAFLGDRVVVMEPRPGRIRRIIDVPLPRTRDRGDPAFVAIKDDIFREFAALDEAGRRKGLAIGSGPKEPAHALAAI